MDALSGIPWWMFCIGGFSFVVVTAGAIAWQVFMGRMEREAEQNEKRGTGMAPVQHPEPLHGWVRMACVMLDDGSSWVEEQPAKAKWMLASDWQINDGAVLQQCLGQLSQQPPTAWNAVRLFRVAMAGYRSGYLDVAGLWTGVRPVAMRLQQQYPSFEAIWMDYLAGYREWRKLPPDGSQDDQMTVQRLGLVQKWRAAPPRVDYRANI